MPEVACTSTSWIPANHFDDGVEIRVPQLVRSKIRPQPSAGVLANTCVVALVDRFAQHCHRVEILDKSWRDKHRLDSDRPKPAPSRSVRRKRP